MTKLDIHFVRKQFPAFSEPTLQGWAFFENAGGSYACGAVIDRLNRYYRQRKVQPYGLSPASALAGEEMDEAHVRLAGYLNVARDEIHFGPSTSQNTYVLAHALRGAWHEGDEIIVTDQDHEANSGVWRRLAKTGLVLKEWHIDPQTGMLDPADLDTLLTDKTRLVAFPHCSNIVGYINPVAEIATKVHDATNALVLVDGVAGAPHGLPDVEALGVDLYLFSLYKTFGPHQGVMAVRRHVLEQVENQGHYFNASLPGKWLTPAGPDHAQVAASAGICDYLDALYDHHFTEKVTAAERGRRLTKLIRNAEAERVTPLFDYLQGRDDVTLVGPADPVNRAPTISMTIKDKASGFVARELAEHNIMAKQGDFYAVRLIEALGIGLEQGVLRLSFVHYTSEAEIDQLILALDRVLTD